MKVECVGRCGQNAHHECPDHCKTFMRRIAEPSAGPKNENPRFSPTTVCVRGICGALPSVKNLPRGPSLVWRGLQQGKEKPGSARQETPGLRLPTRAVAKPAGRIKSRKAVTDILERNSRLLLKLLCA